MEEAAEDEPLWNNQPKSYEGNGTAPPLWRPVEHTGRGKFKKWCQSLNSEASRPQALSSLNLKSQLWRIEEVCVLGTSSSGCYGK